MCLLITGNAQTIRAQLLDTKGLVDNIFKQNPDGLGFMHHDPAQRASVIYKTLPGSVSDAYKALNTQLKSIKGDVALHFRWRTHGTINLEQCHPYPVGESDSGVYLMHNGILRQTAHVKGDKSDTWYFVQKYLKDVPAHLLRDPHYTSLLGEFIGDNRFALLADGHLTVINRDQGIEHGGVWYSNEYAWEPALLIPDYATYTPHFSSFSGVPYPQVDGTPYDGWEGYDTAEANSVHAAVTGGDASAYAKLMGTNPYSSIVEVVDNYTITPALLQDELPMSYIEAVNAWVAYDEDKLFTMAAADPTTTAEALIYFCHASNEASNVRYAA